MRFPLFDRRSDYWVMGATAMLLLVFVVALIAPCIAPDTPERKAHAALNELRKLSMAIDNYYVDTGRLPDGLTDLIRRPESLPGWAGPYVHPDWLRGPQGQRVLYQVPGKIGPYDLSYRQP